MPSNERYRERTRSSSLMSRFSVKPEFGRVRVLRAALCVTANSDCQCLLWIISGHVDISTRCPLYPRKRTFVHEIGMSALGHFRTHALQQKVRYSINSSARTSSANGTSIPSVLAVCKLTSSSTFVGCSLMSASGQTRTLDNVRVTSVKLLIADSKRTFSYVRSGPARDSCAAT
jgi:hypothetical protein